MDKLEPQLSDFWIYNFSKKETTLKFKDELGVIHYCFQEE